MIDNQDGNEGHISTSLLYTAQVLAEYFSIRKDLEQITSDLLRLFAQGNAEILQRLAAGLSKCSPGHPDLPIIYSVIHEIKAPEKTTGGPGKGRKPVISIPYCDVSEDLLDVIHQSHYSLRSQKNLINALREILGAARRAGLEETLNRYSLSALRDELYEKEGSRQTIEIKIGRWNALGRLFDLPDETMTILNNEHRAARLEAETELSKMHIAFRENPVTPLDYARFARVVSEEAYTSKGNRQTIHRLFITAAALSLLSFIPERVSDILKLTVGVEVTRDARGWSSEYFSNKTGEDRSVEYLPDQMTPYLDDLILLGADPGPQGQTLLHLYRHRVKHCSPLFARINLTKAYSSSRVFELTREWTGHGPNAARKAMTDYMAEIGGTPEQVMDLLGHRRISTSEKYYAVFAETIKRKRTLKEINNLREDLAQDRTFRLPNGKLVDLNRIARDLGRSV
jgi:integrase